MKRFLSGPSESMNLAMPHVGIKRFSGELTAGRPRYPRLTCSIHPYPSTTESFLDLAKLLRMGIFACSNKEKPAWLEETSKFCRDAGINIMGWGPDMLTVEAKSPHRAKEITSQLRQLGFKAIEDKDNAHAGMLDLSRNPEAIQAKIASFNIFRRRWDEQIVPLFWAFGSLLLIPRLSANIGGRSSWFTLSLGVLCLVLFFWDGSRIWGWRLELVPEGLRVRRHFCWSTIPWEEISAVVSVDASWGRNQESVFVKLTTHASERLGTFNYGFSRNLRDRLRYELSKRRCEPE